MNAKTKILGALFLALFAILFLRPSMVYDIYSTILGRIILLGILIFLSMKNVTLGLLVALVIITSLNQYGSFTEGLDNMNANLSELQSQAQADGITKASVQAQAQADGITKATIQSNLQAKKQQLQTDQTNMQTETDGVDKEDIKNAIASKSSKTLPTSTTTTTTESFEVKPASPSLLKTTKLEAFADYASAF